MNKNVERERIFDSIFEDDTFKKRDLSIESWCDKARNVKQALTVIDDELAAELEKARKEFSQTRVKELQAQQAVDREIFVDTAKSKLEKYLDEVLEAKEAAFHKACGAPSNDDLALLQALMMREHISPEEIAEAADHLGGNLVALGVLRELAKKNNVFFPTLPTDFRFLADKARKAAEHMINAIGLNTNVYDPELASTFDTSDSVVHYDQYLFYHPDGNSSKMGDFIKDIDRVGFINRNMIADANKIDTEVEVYATATV